MQPSKLRPYQEKLKSDTYQAWNQGAQNIVQQLSTGGGKTVGLADITREHQGASCIMAHRQELVGQLSTALGRAGVRHNIIASQQTKRAIAANHIAELGACFFDPGSKCAVASVDTLIRATGLEAWQKQVTLWVCDEGHHLIKDNKWGSAIERFTHPSVKGLLPTATPNRADRKGLGRHAHGYADVIVRGPPMRWLIDEGYLCDYRIVCPQSDLRQIVEKLQTGASGDWSNTQLRMASRQSRIVSDAVTQYQLRASGRLALTFCTDIETAERTRDAFRAAGVRAELLTGQTPDDARRRILRDYAARRIDQLVTVDIVAEGFDLPAIEVLLLDRPTESLPLYLQQFGRALRPLYADGFDLSSRVGRLAAIANGPKPKALVIDQVGNFMTHGPPDRERDWSLDSMVGTPRGANDAIPYRVCIECFTPYERVHRECPYCGHYPEPGSRASIKSVDGDLAELDAATLAALRGEVAMVDMEDWQYRDHLARRGVPWMGVMAHVKRHRTRQEAQQELRTIMGWWGAHRKTEGMSDSQMQRLFYHQFGVSVIEAQALGEQEARKLAERVAARF